MNDFKRRRIFQNRALSVAMGMLGLPIGYETRIKPKKKCLLKDCAEMTDHNGGYCCAEHCKKDKEKNRCRHCLRIECECSDSDISSEMGAK